MKFFLNPYFLSPLILFLASCASHKDQVFTEVEPTAPEKLEREISLPDEVKAKFQVKGSQAEGTSEKPQDATTQKAEKKKIKKVVKDNGPSEAIEKESETTIIATDSLTEEELQKRSTFKTWDLESKRVWKKFTPYVRVGEELIYEISYLGVLAGHVRMTTKPVTEVAGKEVYHFYAQLKSGRWYDFIYKLDDYIETFVERETFRPVKYSLIQRESSHKTDDLQLFDLESSMTYLDYYRLKDGKEKKENKQEMIPKYFQDSYSALPFMRGVDMQVGDVHQFPIVTRGKIWLLKYEVVGVEEIKIQGSWIKALKIKAETQYPGVLEKRGDILFWFDQSDLKRPVKFQAKVKIGSLEGVLTDYKPGKKIE